MKAAVETPDILPLNRAVWKLDPLGPSPVNRSRPSGFSDLPDDPCFSLTCFPLWCPQFIPPAE